MSVLALVLAALASAAAPHQGALWLGVEGELGIGDNVQLALSEEVRQQVLPTGTTELLTEASARVDLSGGVALQGGYRLSARLVSPTILEHRLAADLRLDHRVGDIKLKVRQRYQVLWVDASRAFEDPDWVAGHMIRTRLGAEARLKPVRPFIFVEPFVPLTGGVSLFKVRLAAGATLPTKAADLRLFTYLDQYTDGDRTVILGLRGSFGTKVKTKKKKDED